MEKIDQNKIPRTIIDKEQKVFPNDVKKEFIVKSLIRPKSMNLGIKLRETH